jgi:uncharacterized protein YkwD
MSCKALGGRLLAPVLLPPASAFAQSGKAEDYETTRPAKAGSANARSALDLDNVAARVLRGVNDFRGRQGRPPVKANAALTKAARYFAGFLARTDKFGHTADGKQPWDRASEHGYTYCIVLENIAWEYNSEGFTAPGLAENFVRGWEHSPGHRKNMLDPDVGDTGVAVAHSVNTGRYYAVQLFGRPRSLQLVFELTNEADAEVKYTVDGKSYSLEPRYTVTHQRCRPATVRVEQAAEGGSSATSRRRSRTWRWRTRRAT